MVTFPQTIVFGWNERAEERQSEKSIRETIEATVRKWWAVVKQWQLLRQFAKLHRSARSWLCPDNSRNISLGSLQTVLVTTSHLKKCCSIIWSSNNERVRIDEFHVAPCTTQRRALSLLVYLEKLFFRTFYYKLCKFILTYLDAKQISILYLICPVDTTTINMVIVECGGTFFLTLPCCSNFSC